MNKSYCIKVFSFVVSVLLFISCVQPEPKKYPDGMLRAIPENKGVGSHSILDFVEEVDNQGLEVHSFMFLRHGRVLAEGYWSPYKADMNHLMNSVSKTLTSTAIGFAVKEKKLKVDDPVITFFPDDLPSVISPHLEKLTIKHLLTMTVGHEKAPVLYTTDENWVRSFLATPIVHEPGKVFQYNSYASYMLSAIIHKVTGMSTFDYLKPRLFEPLEIEGARWETDPRGITCGGWGLRMKTADMAKVGRFYLQNGKWEKKQLLPATWIKEASAVHIYQVDEPTFEQEMYDESAQGYGYQIWRTTHNAYRADGAGNQYIVVMPDQDAVLVVTARVDHMHRVLSLFWEHLFPGIMKKMIRRDEAAKEALRSKLASLKITDPFLTHNNELVYKDMSFAYAMDENELNIREVSFKFEETGNGQLTLTINNTPYLFNFGLDNWQYGETDKTTPYFLNPRRNPDGLNPFPYAAYGSWVNKDELSLQIRFLSDNEYETYICKFGNKQLTIHASNSMQSDKEPVVISGYL